MKRLHILLLALLLGTFPSKSQSLENLYYAQPVGLGSDPLIMPIYGDNGMLLFDFGQKEIFSLRKGNFFTDTLEFARKISEQILHVFWVGDRIVSVNSYYRGCVYQLEQGVLLKKHCTDYDRRFLKSLKKEYGINDRRFTIQLIDESEFILETSSEIIYVNGDRNTFVERNDDLLIESSQRNRIFGNNIVNVVPDKVFYWDQFRNRLTIFSRELVQSKTIAPLDVVPGNGVNQFYYDRATQKKYLWRWDGDRNKGELFQWDISSNEFTKAAGDYSGIIKGVYQGRYYITSDFEDTIGHFFIDPKGEKQDLQLLPDIEINKNN